MLIGKYILVIFHRLFVSDVIKTVTFETENWSKFRDETETWSKTSRPRLLNLVPLPRGSFGGLSPQTKLQAPKLKHETQ